MQIHFGMSDDDDTDSDYEFKPGAESDDDVGSDDSTGAFDVPKIKGSSSPGKCSYIVWHNVKNLSTNLGGVMV